MDSREELRDITAYIHEHITDEITWEALAAQVFLSKYHFHRLFSAVVGTTAARYIREEKLRRALTLLVTTDENITDIAYGLDFTSHDTFSRAFKRMYGETPSALRRRNKTYLWLRRYLHIKHTRGATHMNDLLQDLRYHTQTPFTVNDKRECLPTVELIIKLAETARREGVLALEDIVKHEADTLFMKNGMQLVLDGVDPAIVKDIMQNYILFSSYKGADLLKRLLTMNGILDIQAGLNPHIMRERLFSMLGEEFNEEACLYFGIGKGLPAAEIIERYFSDMETETYPEGTNLLEDSFLSLDNRSLQMILREMSMQDFILAFVGSSKKLQKRLVDNLSLSIATQTINECLSNPVPDKERIVKSQHLMLSIYYRLLSGCADN